MSLGCGIFHQNNYKRHIEIKFSLSTLLKKRKSESSNTEEGSAAIADWLASNYPVTGAAAYQELIVPPNYFPATSAVNYYLPASIFQMFQIVPPKYFKYYKVILPSNYFSTTSLVHYHLCSSIVATSNISELFPAKPHTNMRHWNMSENGFFLKTVKSLFWAVYLWFRL